MLFCFQIQAKGMQMVTQLTMEQFSKLFIGSIHWKFEVCTYVCDLNYKFTFYCLQFVEGFLNNHTVSTNTDLKFSSWKNLLKEIVSR